MTGAALAVPEHVEDAGRSWTVDRAWPAGPDVALELSHPEAPHRRAGHRRADGTVRLLPEASDPRLPALEPLARDGVVVSHRPGRRAVVRRECTFTKVVRPGRGAALRAAADAAAPLGEHVRLPTVLATDDERLVLSALPGRSLLDLASEDVDLWRSAWSDWSTSWTSLAASRTATAAPLVHDAHAEVEVMQQWRTRAEPVLEPATATALAAATEPVVARLLQQQAAETVTCHRDLHDQQVLWDPTAGIGLLDVDTLAVAEAALDLGNLRAHVHLRRLQGLTDATRAEVAVRAVDETARALDVTPQRLRTYEQATFARLVCVYAFRPRWRHLVPSLLAEVR